MPKTSIVQIYQNYQVPPNLQQHMLRVGAVGKLALDHWQGEKIDKQHILDALLVHDMGNLIKFELDKQQSKKMLKTTKKTKASTKNWKKIQQQMIERYGSNADRANELIAQELSLHQRTQKLLMHHSFERLVEIAPENHWEEKLVFWADLRIAPQGLVSAEARIQDLKDRYEHRDERWADSSLYNLWLKTAITIERQLNQRTSINLQEITQQDLEPIVEQLTAYQLEIEV